VGWWSRSVSDQYEYTVRWTEIDATGKPCYDDYSEWTCGHPKTWNSLEGASDHAQRLRDDPADYMRDIVVVRRAVSSWLAVEQQP
jgi:hypothetical protein